MRWIRSYPFPPPQPHEHRSYVIDYHTEAWPMQGFDYSPLVELGEDVCLVEWDIVVSREDMEAFEAHALARPERVLAAHYRLYGVEGQPEPYILSGCAVGADGAIRRVGASDMECDYFGFGMVYLPHELVKRFVKTNPVERQRNPFAHEATPTDTRMTDWTFSLWHRWTLGRRAEIDWTVRPIHLHW